MDSGSIADTGAHEDVLCRVDPPSSIIPPMGDTTTVDGALTALDTCDAALRKLDLRCCEPGRSPSMQRLATALSQARADVAAVGHDADRATLAIDRLEDAGAQVGRLQVGCCAPNRLPLYAELLEGLTTAQLEVSRAIGQGH
jgi:hypothetical protein